MYIDAGMYQGVCVFVHYGVILFSFSVITLLLCICNLFLSVYVILS